MRKATILLVLLALFNTIMATGCAMLTRGRAQKVPVTSSPIGAAVSVNGERQGLTPVEVVLARRLRDPVIRIESPGYNPVEIRIRRKVSTDSVLGDFLLGAIPGFGVGYLAWIMSEASDEGQTKVWATGWLIGTVIFGGIYTGIDAGSGRGFVLTPKELEVTLTKTVGVPRVDTIDIDPNDVRNIKWIRVRLGG